MVVSPRIGGAKTLESVPRSIQADTDRPNSQLSPLIRAGQPPSERRAQRDLITIAMTRVPSVRTPVPIK